MRNGWREKSTVESMRIAGAVVVCAGIFAGAPIAAAAPGDSGRAASPSTVPIPKASIGVSNIVVRLEGRDDIGLAGADYRIHLIEHMRERGFTAVGAENLVFDKDESHRAEFRVGGIVKELDCTHTRGGMSCGLGVEWQLLDVGRDAVVYKVLTRSTVFDVSEANKTRVAAHLLLGAFDSLLARDRFRTALAAGTSTRRSTDATFPSATFARCAPLSKKMPEAAEQVLSATVVVRRSSGGGFGSGFFISPDGLVLTAAHVVDGAKVTLRMRDGVEIEAIPVRVAWRTDVALLRPIRKLSSQCLSPGLIEPSMGAELYTAGAPARLELAFSLTRGIVSAMRERDGVRILQTDAPVSPGNSGGPMVDSSGAVVAVTSSKIAGGAVEGVGFGVPIATTLAALGLVPAATTDTWLHEAPAMTKPEIGHDAVIEDTPDAKVSLDPESDRQRAEAARKSAVFAAEEAKRKAQRDREESREQATPTYLKVFRWGGLTLAAGGAIAAAASFSSFDPATTKHSSYNSLALANTLGWIGLGVGGAGFLASYVFRPSLAPVKTGSAFGVRSVSLGLGGVRVEGAF